MPYDPEMVKPMREEMTANGFQELTNVQEVDSTLGTLDGTALVFVNSVCGCSAGQARPGVVHAAQTSGVKPDKLTTVFAGQDLEATEKARGYFSEIPPSSPSIALLKNGKLVFMLERSFIEMRPAEVISEVLTQAFEEHCS